MRLKLILAATALCLGGPAAIAQELTGTLEKIRSTGIIAIGHRESSIPFSYYDKNEKVVGFAVDLCYLVADAVKVNLGLAKLEIKLVPITLVVSGVLVVMTLLLLYADIVNPITLL